MDLPVIAKVLPSVSNASGVAHAGTYAVWGDRAEIVLHTRLPELARRKMRRKWSELVAGERNPPRLSIRTHKCAM